jgi:hypothetical protein
LALASKSSHVESDSNGVLARISDDIHFIALLPRAESSLSPSGAHFCMSLLASLLRYMLQNASHMHRRFRVINWAAESSALALCCCENLQQRPHSLAHNDAACGVWQLNSLMAIQIYITQFPPAAGRQQLGQHKCLVASKATQESDTLLPSQSVSCWKGEEGEEKEERKGIAILGFYLDDCSFSAMLTQL